MDVSRLQVLASFIEVDRYYKQMMAINTNYCNIFELNRQIVLTRSFCQKSHEMNLAMKELYDINQTLPNTTDAQDIHRLIIRRMEVMDIIDFHNKIPENFNYSLQEVLYYTDYIENNFKACNLSF